MDNFRTTNGYGFKGFSKLKTGLDKGHKNQFHKLISQSHNLTPTKILSVKSDSVELHLVDEDSKWNEIEIIKFSDISYLGFDTEYEREIKKNVV